MTHPHDLPDLHPLKTHEATSLVQSLAQLRALTQDATAREEQDRLLALDNEIREQERLAGEHARLATRAADLSLAADEARLGEALARRGHAYRVQDRDELVFRLEGLAEDPAAPAAALERAEAQLRRAEHELEAADGAVQLAAQKADTADAKANLAGAELATFQEASAQRPVNATTARAVRLSSYAVEPDPDRPHAAQPQPSAAAQSPALAAEPQSRRR